MKHQEIGTQKMIKDPWVALFDDPGMGKSKQVIDAAIRLYKRGSIDSVVIVCPAQVKFNWLDPELGELRRWAGDNIYVDEIGGKTRWYKGDRALTYFVTSYEYLRLNTVACLEELKSSAKRYWLVMDESSYLKNRTTKQWKACYSLRTGRVKGRGKWRSSYRPAVRSCILNGTPTGNSLIDLWAQFQLLSADILGMTYWNFMNRYAIKGGWMGKQIVGYRDKQKLTRLLKPYVLSRRISEAIDLPAKSCSVREVNLSPSTWKMYQQMRDELLIELDQQEYTAVNAAVKMMRLSQLTSGFVSSMEDGVVRTAHVGTEKNDWLIEHLSWASPDESVIVWCWFRHQIEELYERLSKLEGWNVSMLYGGSKDKSEVVGSFHPENTSRDRRQLLVAQPAAGGMGLNLAAANVNIYLSSDYSFLKRDQSECRIYRPGQTKPVRITDLLAVGPKGQRTIDHVIYKARQTKDELSKWLKSRWRKELT